MLCWTQHSWQYCQHIVIIRMCLFNLNVAMTMSHYSFIHTSSCAMMSVLWYCEDSIVNGPTDNVETSTTETDR